MPRNMSFMLTTDQIKNKTKTVTRRLGWDFLKVGDIINACEKCQGLKKGEKINKLCRIRITDIRKEALFKMFFMSYGIIECQKEGFPDRWPDWFVEMFCKHNKCDPDTHVNRIEFEYI